MKTKLSNKIDMITMDVPLFIRMLEYAKEDAKTDMDLHIATERALQLSKEKGDLSMECYDNIVGGTKKEEPKEQTMSGSSGAFSAPLGNTPVIKRPIQGISEETGTGVSAGAAYDVSFSSSPKHKDPLKIDGVKSIAARAHYMNKKKLPKWGGPGGVFIKIKEKCKKFPYCNQGDIHAIQTLRESIEEVAKERGLSNNEVEKIVLKGIREIFM
jgi:hypothetical protein